MTTSTVSSSPRTLAVLLVLAVAGCDARSLPEIGAPDDGEPIADRFGMAQQLHWGASDEDREVRAQQLEQLASLGVRNERIDFTWYKLEVAPGEWDFSQLDPVVEDASLAGVRLLGVLAYGNPIYPTVGGEPAGEANLALDNPPAANYPPLDPADYARFVRVVVERYGDVVKDWELWNEPNIGYRFFRPEENPRRYADLVRAATKSGREACADCRFLLGGLSVAQPIPKLEVYTPAPFFLREMYAVAPDLDMLVDGIAFHPYQYPKDPPEHETEPFPDRFQGSLTTQIADMRLVMDRDGNGQVPLWITENGWPTNPGIPEGDDEIARVFGLDPDIVAFGRYLLGDEDFAKVVETVRGVSEEDQARYLVRSTLLAMQGGIPRIIVYGLHDYPLEPEINQEAAFGVFRVDGSEKVAVSALRTLLTRYGDYRFVSDVAADLDLKDPTRALAFRRGDDVMVALWRWSGGDEEVELRSLPATAVVVDQAGQELTRPDWTGAVTLQLGKDVTYLELPSP